MSAKGISRRPRSLTVRLDDGRQLERFVAEIDRLKLIEQFGGGEIRWESYLDCPVSPRIPFQELLQSYPRRQGAS